MDDLSPTPPPLDPNPSGCRPAAKPPPAVSTLPRRSPATGAGSPSTRALAAGTCGDPPPSTSSPSPNTPNSPTPNPSSPSHTAHATFDAAPTRRETNPPPNATPSTEAPNPTTQLRSPMVNDLGFWIKLLLTSTPVRRFVYDSNFSDRKDQEPSDLVRSPDRAKIHRKNSRGEKNALLAGESRTLIKEPRSSTIRAVRESHRTGLAWTRFRSQGRRRLAPPDVRA